MGGQSSKRTTTQYSAAGTSAVSLPGDLELSGSEFWNEYGGFRTATEYLTERNLAIVPQPERPVSKKSKMIHVDVWAQTGAYMRWLQNEANEEFGKLSGEHEWKSPHQPGRFLKERFRRKKTPEQKEEVQKPKKDRVVSLSKFESKLIMTNKTMRKMEKSDNRPRSV